MTKKTATKKVTTKPASVAKKGAPEDRGLILMAKGETKVYVHPRSVLEHENGGWKRV